MYAQVNGVKLYFDVEGAGLVADGPPVKEKPTLVLLYGGPGFDHALFKPHFSALCDGPENEQGRLDFRSEIARVRCPTLLIGSERDPVMPIACAETIAASLPAHLVALRKI
jgi:pimeloyl-ACP methyl ester carboxylesterase